MHKIQLGAVAGVLSLLVAAGCAKPPVEAQKAAETVMNNALTAQGEIYAAAAMKEAQKVWEDAEVKMKSRAYKDAQIAYTAAKAQFEMALGQIEAGKKAMAEENQMVLKIVEQSADELTKLVVGKKVAKLEAGLKQAWETESKQIQDNLKKAKDAATAPVDAKKVLEETKTLVEKWLGIFKK